MSVYTDVHRDTHLKGKFHPWVLKWLLFCSVQCNTVALFFSSVSLPCLIYCRLLGIISNIQSIRNGRKRHWVCFSDSKKGYRKVSVDTVKIQTIAMTGTKQQVSGAWLLQPSPSTLDHVLNVKKCWKNLSINHWVWRPVISFLASHTLSQLCQSQ